MSKKIHSVTLAPKNMIQTQTDVKEIVQERRLENLARKNNPEYQSKADRLAESTIYHRNWKWPNADDYYPLRPGMRLVDKYYPYARGGPLLVDEPEDIELIEACYYKQKILQKLGHRYVVLDKNTDIMNALEQLGEK